MNSAGLKLRAKRFDTHACLRNQARQRARLDRLIHGDDDGAGVFPHNQMGTGLPPIFTRAEMNRINAELPQVLALLEPGETSKDIREWHEASTYLFELAMEPKILDLVEGILGANF